jgi:hypothetical protein
VNPNKLIIIFWGKCWVSFLNPTYKISDRTFIMDLFGDKELLQAHLRGFFDVIVPCNQNDTDSYLLQP